MTLKSRDELEHDLSVINGRLNAAVEELRSFAQKNNQLRNEVEIERSKIKMLETTKAINDVIIQKQITRQNEENNALLERIDFLTKKLREYGYHDKLGD